MMADVHVTGLRELQAFMDTLPAKLEKNIMRGALRAGVNVIKPVAASNVHSVSGALAAGLKVGSSAKGGVVKGVLRAKGIHGYIAMWVEFGTKAHLIKVQDSEKNINLRLSAKRGKKVLESMTTINRRVLQIGNTFVGPTVSHPGSGPKKFLRRALDQEAQNAVIAAAEYMRNRLATKEGLNTADIVIAGEDE